MLKQIGVLLSGIYKICLEPRQQADCSSCRNTFLLEEQPTGEFPVLPRSYVISFSLCLP